MYRIVNSLILKAIYRSNMSVIARTFFRSLLTVTCGLICVFLLQFPPALAAPQINNQINYQARLMDASGFPVADGNYSVIFSLYDASSAGTRLWTANGTVGAPTALTVNVTNGLFTVLLGDTSVAGGSQNTLDTVNWNSDQIYLGVTINADAEMAPRKRFASAPQAFNARQLQGMYASSTASGNQTLFTLNQTQNDAATGTRSTLDVRSNGTSNSNDFLVRGINDTGATVFSINRQGSVTSTNLFVSGLTSSTNLNANIASFATATVAGQGICLSNGLFCSTGSVTEADTLQTVSNRGSFTTTTLSLFGGLTTSNLTATGTTSLQNTIITNGTTTNFAVTNFVNSNLVPAADLAFSLGTASNRWNASLGDVTSTNVTTTNLSATNAFINTLGVTTFSASSGTITNFLFANATGTNLFVTNFTATNGTITSLSAVSVTTTNLLAASTTVTGTLTANNATASTLQANSATFATATVSGQAICLSNGVGCPSGAAEADTLQTVSNRGSFTTTTLSLFGGFVAASSSVTGTLNVAGTSNLLRDVYVGTSTYSVTLNSDFVINGDDLFVAGNIGSVSSIFSNSMFVAGEVGPTLFGDGFINQTDGALVISANAVSSVQPSISIIAGDVASGLAGDVNIRAGNGLGGNPAGSIYLTPGDSLGQPGHAYLNPVSGSSNTPQFRFTSLGGGYISLESPSTSNSVNFVLPFADGASSTVIGTNGFGGLSFVSVCLTDGTSCPSGSGSDLNWTYNLAGDFVRNATGTTDIAIGSSTLANSPFVFLNNTTTSRFLIGQNSSTGAGADLVIGATTASGMNSLFQLTGDDLFVAGNIGSASSVYTNGAFIAGPGSTSFGDGFISKNNGYLSIKSTSGTRITNALEQFISSEISPTFLGSTGVIPKASFFVTAGNYAYVLANSNELHIVDISNPNSPTSTGFVTVPSTPTSIDYDGAFVYVGGGSNNVYVYDVTDKKQPILSRIIFGLGQKNKISGKYLYSLNNLILRISDLEGNTLGTVSLSGVGIGTDLVVQNGRAYVIGGSGNTELFVIDVQNPNAPIVLDTYDLVTGANDIAVNDRYVYAADAVAGLLWIFDVRNSSDIRVAATTSITGADNLFVSGRYAYVGAGTNINVVDVASSTAPSLVKTFATSPGSIRQFATQGRYGIFIGGGTSDGYLQIYDMRGTELQSLTAHSLQAGSARIGDLLTVEGETLLSGGLRVGVAGIASVGSLSVAATNTTSTFMGALQAVRLQATGAFSVLGSVSLGGSFSDLITINGSFASDLLPDVVGRNLGSQALPWDGFFRNATATSLFVASRGITAEPPGGLIQSANIVSTSTLVGGNPIGVYASDRYLYYIGGNRGLEIVDITDPTAPFVTASSSLFGFSISDFVSNGSLIAMAGALSGASQGVRVLDVSDFSNVTSVGELAFTSGGSLSIDMSGKYAFVTGSASSALYIVDISVPGTPVLVSTLTGLGSPNKVKVRDGFAYVTENTSNRLYIIDVRQPNQPVIKGFVAVANAPQEVYQQGRYAYVALSTTQFETIDVSDPTAPFGVATSTCPSYACTGGFIAGDYFLTRGRDFFASRDIINFWDISSSAGPQTLSRLAIDEPTAQLQKLTKYGSHVYTIHSNVFLGATTGVLSIIDSGGIKTDGIQAGTAEFGTLMVRNAAEIAKQLTVQGGLQVGTNGILSLGSISSFATGTISSFAGMFNVQTSTSTPAVLIQNTASGGQTWGAYIDQLSVGSNITATGATDYSMVITYASSATRGGLCIDDTATGVTCPTNVGASIMADGAVISNAFDLAEMYSVTGTTEAGDVLVLYASSTATVMRSSGVAYDSKIIGIISTDPGFVLGWGGGAKVALTGRVPTKVSMNNGPIAVGDALVSSDVPGFAMKATQPGMILGYALESVSATGTAQVFVNVGFWAGLTFGPTGQIQVDDSGNVSIMNDLHIGGKLFPSLKGGGIQNDWYLFVNADDPTSTYISTNADGFMSMDTYDFAERYYSPDELESGDVVVVSDSGRTHVQRSMNEDAMVLGIVSTRPAFIAGRPATSTYPIALSGRVPTKVSGMNGAIKAGDPLSPTSIPGVVAKAVKTGPIVGLALEGFDGANVGKIEVFVNPSYWVNKSEFVQSESAGGASQIVVSQDKQGFATVSAGSKKVRIEFPSLGAYPNVQVTPRGSVAGGWWTDSYTDTGFEIIMADAQDHDVVFAWRVEATTGSDIMRMSDGTYASVDPLTGAPVGLQAATSTPEILLPEIVNSSTTSVIETVIDESATTTSAE